MHNGRKLQIAKDLALPLDAVTQTFGILGKRGGGKSYTAKVLAEEMLRAKAHIACVDPIGNWWGLRVGADGTSAGLPITVMGGEYGDLPIEPTEKAGELVARLIIEEKISVVVDLSLFRKGEQAVFMIGWAETLYRLNREALHVFVDEADAFAPQRPVGNLAPRLLGAMEDLVRRGRARGLGITMITQRSASINKDLLTQIEVLIAKRTIAPQDREAIEAWVEVHGTPEQQKTMMQSLPSLPKEAAWIWSPGWLDLFKLVSIRKLYTMDSSATPEVGRRTIEPRRLAEVDLEKVRERMAATIARAKADDPRELRKRIAELEKAAKMQAPLPGKVEPIAAKDAIEKATVRGAAQMAEQMAREFRTIVVPLRKAMRKAIDGLRDLVGELEAVLPPESLSNKATGNSHSVRGASNTGTFPTVDLPAERTENPRPLLARSPVQPLARSGASPARSPDGLTGPEQRILDAIAWLESIGVDTPEQPAVAFLAGYTFGGGAFNNPRGALRTKSFVEYAGDAIRLTAAGRRLANWPVEVLDSAELQRRVLDRLPGPERRILEVILKAYPDAIGYDECARAAGYTPGGGAFNNPRGRLRSLGLIDYPGQGMVRARDLLFLVMHNASKKQRDTPDQLSHILRAGN